MKLSDRDDIRRAYHEDAVFKGCVDYMQSLLEQCFVTPRDMSRAAVLACELHAARHGLTNTIFIVDGEQVKEASK